MSLVMAIKDKDRIVIGADKQSSTGDIKDHNVIKIWKVPDMPGAIMGGVGTVRASQILQYSSIIDKNYLDQLDTCYVVNHIVPTIVNTLELNGVSCNVPETPYTNMPNAFIFAYKDKAWMIWHDLSVTEITDYVVIGSGADVARGVLFATADKNPFDRIVTSIEAAADCTLYVDDGIDILCTKTYKADAKQLVKALKIDLDVVFTEDASIEPDVTTKEDTAPKESNKKVKK